MKAPLGILAFLLGVLVFGASLLQKQVAGWVGHPMQEKSTVEKSIDLLKGTAGSARMVEIPSHPVAATIFWIGLTVAALALFAWIVEDTFWVPLIAASLGIGAAFFHMAWIPALLAIIQAGRGRVTGRRTTTRRRSSYSRSRLRNSPSKGWTRTNKPD